MSGGCDLDQVVLLCEVDGLNGQVLSAVAEGLPPGPPVSGEVDAAGHSARQLGD
jgi:hypothetical protein